MSSSSSSPRLTGLSPRAVTRRPVVSPVSALLAAIVVLTLGVPLPIPVLRAVVVLPLALLVPGYAVAFALFGRRPPLDAAPLLALAALLSMAFYPLLALALHLLGLPLAMGSVLAGTDAAALLLTATRAMRERRAPMGHGTFAAPGPEEPLHKGDSRVALWGLGVAAVLVFIGVAATDAGRVVPTSTDAPYTAFYLSGRWSHLSSAVFVAPGRRLVVAVGIANRTGRMQAYRLSPLLDDAHWRARTLVVPAGSVWTGTVEGRVPAGQRPHRLSITLHQRGRRDPLRPLVLWVRAGAATARKRIGREQTWSGRRGMRTE